MPYRDFTLVSIEHASELRRHEVIRALCRCATLRADTQAGGCHCRSRGPSQMVLTAPVAVGVEAKNENLMSGIGQCLATMVAARGFNTQAQTGVTIILGAVTSSTRWKFLRLAGDDATLDFDEYDLQHDVARILGILASAIG